MAEENPANVRFWDRVTKPEDRHPLFDQIEKLLKNRTAVAGMIIILVFALAALLAPVISPHNPNENALYDQLKRPVWSPEGAMKNILGTDDLGRARMTRFSRKKELRTLSTKTSLRRSNPSKWIF